MLLNIKEENVMKNLFTSVILGIVLASISLAQPSANRNAKASEIKIAVVEFSPGPNASGIKDDAKRQLQTGMAAALAKSAKFDVADVRWTRNESQENLAALNGGSSTAAAVKLGKLLSVSYVLTGVVVEYTPQDADGFGRVILKTRIIDVSNGKVIHTEEITQKSTGVIKTTGTAEMHSKTVMPAVKKLGAIIEGLKF